jgi:uncharacterized Fe-S cluster-containing protein
MELSIPYLNRLQVGFHCAGRNDGRCVDFQVPLIGKPRANRTKDLRTLTEAVRVHSAHPAHFTRES